MNYVVLRNEIDADPLARGYSGMSDAQVVADINTEYRTRIIQTLDASDIYEATDSSEFQALVDAQKSYVRDIWSLGVGVHIASGSNARGVYQSVFGTESNTWAALLAVAQETISRGMELGLGIVRESDVTKARAL